MVVRLYAPEVLYRRQVEATASATSSAFTAALALKANIASPTLTGTPAAPTAAVGTDTTQIATTAFVQDAVEPIKTAVSISGGTLTIALSPVKTTFTVTINANITTFTVTGLTAGVPASFTIFATANGTGYTWAWGSTKWPGGSAPVVTTTNNRTDVFTFAYDGTSLYGFIAGQDYA